MIVQLANTKKIEEERTILNVVKVSGVNSFLLLCKALCTA